MPIQARTEFAAAINQIASEKGVEIDVVLDAIRQAALAAYRKDLSLRGEVIPEDIEEYEAKIDPQSGEITINSGDKNVTPPGFARIAAQTAKQVITQRLNEAEKGAIMDEYAQKVGAIVSGLIQRQEGNTYFIDLGRAEGIMPPPEQSRNESYVPNQRLKFYIKEIRESGRGPEIIVSRSDAGLVKGLFAIEVPEIQSGAVEIKEIAREAGGRTKLAAVSSQEGVDPVGSLVGQKGVRVQAVMNELGEEKIDIVSYSDDPARFIVAALSPAKDIQVFLDEETKIAKVKIPDNQLSLAIGKGGQNVRLAAKLTGWKIDIEGTGESAEVSEDGTVKEAEGDKPASAPPSPELRRPSKATAGKEEGTKEDKDVVEDTQAGASAQATDDVTTNKLDKAVKEEEKKESGAEEKKE
ncbi:transcription termination/antitermination protein NusA [Candidatus Daviesbacteria bacterium]|nr:transcription termination/antitermination protein NusA [Candidatus Daviesbacteria bacterium]